MTRNRNLQIRQYLKVADNSNYVEGSKTAKIKSLYDAFNMTLRQFGILRDKLSIDQTMVSHKGLYSIHQYLKSKPNKTG